jgi:uncharacterized alkaline shock family protein YloU
MKPSYAFLMVVGSFIYLVLGCFLFFMVFLGVSTISDVYKDLERLYSHRLIAGLVGLFFLSSGYAAIKFLIKQAYKEDIFVVDTDHGKTSISRVAIQDLLRKTLRKYDTIKSYKLKLDVKNKVLVLKIILVLWLGINASDVTQKLQGEILRKLSKIIGIPEENLNIHIEVTRVLERTTSHNE